MKDFAGAIKGDLVQALDISDSAMADTVLDAEFMTENASLIKDALDGDAEALDALHDKYQE